MTPTENIGTTVAQKILKYMTTYFMYDPLHQPNFKIKAKRMYRTSGVKKLDVRYNFTLTLLVDKEITENLKKNL